MREMNRYIKNQNFIFFAVLFEFIQIIAVMAIKNKEPIYTFCTQLYMLIKIFNLIHIKLICYPSIIANYNYPIIG